MSETRITNDKTGGQKGTKPERFDLIPPHPLRLLAQLYGKGAEKYDPWNWARGYDWSLSIAALQRHLNAFLQGEDMDEETGVPHVINVAWHGFTLAQFMRDHPELDDRMHVAVALDRLQRVQAVGRRRVRSRDLAPGTVLRRRDGGGEVLLLRRKRANESRLPGWWVKAGGIADCVVDGDNWEVVDDHAQGSSH